LPYDLYESVIIGYSCLISYDRFGWSSLQMEKGEIWRFEA
jgi:hypothetical protein